MKAIPFKIPKDKHHLLRVQIDEGDHFYDKLHYHPEYQITAISKGKGLIYSGNNIHPFEEGDVLFIGPDMPHMLKSNQSYYDKNSPGVYSTSLFFDDLALGDQFIKLANLDDVLEVLSLSKRGIVIKNKQLFDKLDNVVEKKGIDLVISFLNILKGICISDKVLLNTETYNLTIDETVGQRLNDILSYTFKHIQSGINIEEIAKVANLSKSQFSRYFKLHTRKTYIQFLNELRIENACTMLRDTAHTVQYISHETGFQNIANFNRQFKKCKGVSPRVYRNRTI